MKAKEIKEQAKKEFEEEKTKKAVEGLKMKLVELDKAQKVVRNIEREIEDFEDELSE